MSSIEQIEALIESIHLTSLATAITNPRLPDNPIIAVNAAFEQLTGHTAEQVRGKNCRLLRGPATEAEQSERLGLAVREGRATMEELLNYRRDGSIFRNAVMIAPIFDDEGTIALFIGSQMEVPLDRVAALSDRSIHARLQLERLTARQLEVLRLMSRGLLNKQIGYELGISEKTVKMHRACLLSSLNARASADAIRLAVEAGL